MGDFDGDGRDEMFVTSQWGIGVLGLNGDPLTTNMLAPNGTQIWKNWLLDTSREIG